MAGTRPAWSTRSNLVKSMPVESGTLSDIPAEVRAMGQGYPHQLMDRYALGARLGGGGAGEVFSAHDTLLDRRVAIKFLHVHLAGDGESAARFNAEAQASARLNHPGVVPVYDAGRAPDGRPYL